MKSFKLIFLTLLIATGFAAYANPPKDESGWSFVRKEFKNGFIRSVIRASNGADIGGTLASIETSGDHAVIDGMNNREYVINSMLLIDNPYFTLEGENNATIKDGPSIAGDLKNYIRFIQIFNTSNVTIKNLKIKKGTGTFTYISTGGSYQGPAGVIDINNASYNRVENVTFDFTFAYGLDYYATRVRSTGAYPRVTNNVITECKAFSLGYSGGETNAHNNTISYCYTKNATQNGIRNTGNRTESPCYDNKVLYNHVEDVAYMGIEIWGNSMRTHTIGNIIDGTGKFYTNGGFGISEVGGEGLVKNNQIRDYGIYGIEIAGNSGTDVINNTMSDHYGFAIGINMNISEPVGWKYKSPSVIAENKIYGVDRGIALESEVSSGAGPLIATIKDNYIENWKEVGIGFIGVQSFEYATLVIDGNIFSQAVANTQNRIGINISYTTSLGRSNIKVSDNIFNWLGNNTVSTGFETGIQVTKGGVDIVGNVFSTRGDFRKSDGNWIKSITNNGINGTIDSVYMHRNRWTGTINAPSGINAYTLQ